MSKQSVLEGGECWAVTVRYRYGPQGSPIGYFGDAEDFFRREEEAQVHLMALTKAPLEVRYDPAHPQVHELITHVPEESSVTTLFPKSPTR
jgi:hypothetical protein